jgi:hypothetical protein
LHALDAVNFLMADVPTGVGPFLAIYLAASPHWNPRDIGVALLGLGALAIVFFHGFAGVVGGQVVMGVVGTFFPPAMAGMTLGIVGRQGLDLRIGRNETFNHAGNLFAAITVGLLGYWFTGSYIFYSTGFLRGYDRRNLFYPQQGD